MTAKTAPMAMAVVTPEISISRRILPARRAVSGSEISSDTVLLMGNEGHTEEVTIAAEEAGERLDRVLAARIETLSRSRLKALILGGAVAIGGRTILDPGYRVKSGEAVAVAVPPPEEAEPQGENIPLNV